MQGDPSDNLGRLKALVAEQSITLDYSEHIAPARGTSAGGKITLLPGQCAAEEFATLADETAHALLHQGEQRSQTTRSVRETEPEAVAFVICEAIGLNARNSPDYIQLYSGDKETLAQSLENVQRASAEILPAIPLSN